MNFRIAVPSKTGVPVFDLQDCVEVAVVDIDTGRISRVQTAPIDPKDGERLARQLEDMGVDILVAGGIRAETLYRLNRSRVNVATCIHGKTVEDLVDAFMGGSPSIPSHTDAHMPAG